MANYEKLYKESLNKLQEVLNNAKKQGHIIVRVEDLENTFPELKESEDDKIRKMIINTLNRDKILTEDEAYDCVVWLEKQGKQKPIIDGILTATNYDKMFQNCNGRKSDDKSEPKFHEGEWIISHYNHIAYIKSIDEKNYFLSCGYGNNERLSIDCINRNWRLWTIQDAKDGDVLVGSELDVILMFRGIGNTEWDDVIDYHCYYDCYRECFIVQEDVEYWGNTENNQLKPATKEQRDLLFSKMKEAGYEWDAEKKELKKIHNALEECEIENIEHGKYYYCIKDYFAGGKKQASKGDVVQALRGLPIMALGVKANEYFLPVNSIKQKTDWSEDDESTIKDIIEDLEYAERKGYVLKNNTFLKEIYWLNSLKERLKGE